MHLSGSPFGSFYRPKWEISLPYNILTIRGGGGGTWVNFCWLCAAGISESLLYPIIVYSVANYRPQHSHFWANRSYSRSQLCHFLFLWIDSFSRLNEEPALLFICAKNILVRLLTVNMKNCLTPKNPVQIHFEFAYFSFSFGIETIYTFIHSRSSLKNHTQFQSKMSLYLFPDQKQEPYPMGRHIPI